MKITKKVLAVMFCITMIASAAGCSRSSDGVTKDTSISWWIYQGEESSYYSDYRENPVVDYLLTKSWGTDNAKIDLEFLIPVAGAEKDNCVTLISTGEYPDIMDMAVYPGSITELYADGIALDLTEYVEQYMPNYLAFLDANPDLKATAMNVVDGEKKYLGLYSYSDAVPAAWGGYQYRRDWIIKYGKNPTDGSAFSGAYAKTNEDGTPNLDTWEDNVVFPSGGSDPVYISDWEWMLQIFQTAIEDQKISDGYPMSLSYPGFFAPGDLVCAFGGGSARWYVNPDGKMVYGPTDDGFRTYIQCMNTWYKNGWIDKAFSEHAQDQFYAIDDVKVRSGKVGLWYGYDSQLGGKMDDGSGMVVFAASQPINDIYGTDAHKNVEPYTMYQTSREGNMIMITSAAKDKDLSALFTMLDYLYSDEGSILKTFGLSKEQYEVTQNEFYSKIGFTEGGYKKNEDGTYLKFRDKLDNVYTSANGTRLIGLERTALTDLGNEEVRQHNIDQWTKYKSTGTLGKSFENQLSIEDAATVSKINTNAYEFLTKNVPNFIRGSKDPYKDDDWNSYLKAISKYCPDTVTQIYQNLYDSLNK